MMNGFGLTYDATFTMPFGRYKGQPLDQVPTATLSYHYRWPELWPKLKRIFQAELLRRGLPFGKYQDLSFNGLPTEYVHFMLANVPLTQPWKELMEIEWHHRHNGGIYGMAHPTIEEIILWYDLQDDATKVQSTI